MEKEKPILWRRFGKKLPPDRVTFLLWMGISDSDGGFPVVAKVFRDMVGEPYVRFHGADEVWKVLFRCELEDCLWAEIPLPDCAAKRLERHKAKTAENMRKRGLMA